MRFILHLPFATHLTNLSMQHASCYQASGRILWVRALICKHKLPPWGCWVWLSAIAFQLSSTRRSASPAREGAADERHHRHSVSFRNGVVTDLSHGICSLTPQSVLPAQSGSWCVSAAWAPSSAPSRTRGALAAAAAATTAAAATDTADTAEPCALQGRVDTTFLRAPIGPAACAAKSVATPPTPRAAIVVAGVAAAPTPPRGPTAAEAEAAAGAACSTVCM